MPAGEVLGKPITILGDERDAVFDRVRAGTFTTGEVRLRSRDGRFFLALMSVVHLRNEGHDGREPARSWWPAPSIPTARVLAPP